MILIINTSYSISVDCPSLISLAQRMNMDVRSSFWSQLQGDCCAAYSGDSTKLTTSLVICNQNGRVTGLQWNGLNLNGTIDMSKLPPLLTSIDMYYNNFNGLVPSSWPSSITVINFNRNQYIGSIPNIWPDGLQELHLGENQLTGGLPNNWPSSLKVLELYTNIITGPIPSNLPNGLQLLNLGNNRMNGTIPVLPLSLTFFHIDKNNFKDDIAKIPSGIQDLSIGYNNLFGTLTLNQPLIVLISNNSISDIRISDTSRLTAGNCDISYNPLLNNPNVAGLTICKQIGLYKTVTTIISSTNSMSKLTTTTDSKLNLRVSSISKNILKTQLYGIPQSAISLFDTTIHSLDDFSPTTLISRAITTTVTFSPNSETSDISLLLIYGLLLGFVFVCILAVLAKKMFKHPKMSSRFVRKNSYGTLNTFASKNNQ